MEDEKQDEIEEVIEECANFVIDDDGKADWAVEKIKAAMAERDRLIDLVNLKRGELDEQERQIKEKYEMDTSYLLELLRQYAKTVTMKETKTQKTYKLLAGSIVVKKESDKLVKNDDQLTAWLKANGHKEFVKVTETPMWKELKEQVTVDSKGRAFIAETGELVDGVTVEHVPEALTVK